MKKLRNILALLMVVVMLVAVMPMNVFAGEGDPPVVDEITEVKITSDITGELKAGDDIKKPTLTVEGDNATVTFGQWYKGDAEASKKFEEGNYTYTFTIAPKGNNAKFADNLKVTLNNVEVTATEVAGEKVYKSPELEAKAAEPEKKDPDKKDPEKKDPDKKDPEKKDPDKKDPDKKDPEKKDPDKKDPDKKDPDKKPEEKPVTPTKEKTVKVVTIGNGTASVDNENAINRQLVTVTAKPYSGYVVDSIVVRDGLGKKLTLFNEKYKNYYYDDYPYYLRSRWYRGYDYDDYIRWCNTYDYSRYDYDSFKTWCRRNGYSYDYDDFRRFYDWDDIYDYGWYNRYDYSYLNQADFVMPNSAVTVEVTFTSASYWYDDYYYYRYYRNKKDNYYERQKKAEEKAKEEEEAKAKAEAAKQPQIYENKAVISIGSNVLDKVSKNVHTVHQMDAPAYVNGGRVMLPLRYVAEALGLQVSWVPETKTVIIWDLTQRVEIPVKSNRIIVNGITYTSDVKPEIKNERTMLPIANIARALGLIDGSDIVWDQYNKQVTLTRKVLSK